MKEHIEQLESLVRLIAGSSYAPALRAVIAFMNAAKPLDEEAERERCRAVEACRMELGGGTRTSCAQAHAEGYAKSEHERTALTERCDRQDHALKLMSQLGTETERQLVAQLSAAQAEIERFTEAYATQTLELHEIARQLHTITTPSRGLPLNEERCRLELREYISRAHALETKLTAAQAEIDNHRHELSEMVHMSVHDALETKLTNLRTAAERMLSWYDHCQARDREFRAAIEASR